jgi:hypothetical protein
MSSVSVFIINKSKNKNKNNYNSHDDNNISNCHYTENVAESICISCVIKKYILPKQQDL